MRKIVWICDKCGFEERVGELEAYSKDVAPTRVGINSYIHWEGHLCRTCAKILEAHIKATVKACFEAGGVK